jgi:DamX protein
VDISLTNPTAAFGSELPSGGLYISPVLQQRTDLIAHLLEFGRQLILLTGEPGTGKSTVLRSIAGASAERWRCVTLNAGPLLSAQSLLTQVAAALDIDADDSAAANPLIESLRQKITHLERNGKTVVLMVDDADQLPVETVSVLLGLARTEEPLAEARVLMTAAPEHAALLAALQRDRPQHGLVHVVEIPPLAETETRAFLEQRLGALGATVDEWFSPETIAHIGQEANGNPGVLVALARQAMMGRAPSASQSRPALPWENAVTAARKQLANPKLRPLMAGVLAVLGIGLWFIFSGAPAPAPTPLSTNTEVPAPTPAPVEAPAVPPASPASDATASTGDRQRMEITLPDSGGTPDPTGTTAPASTAEMVPLPPAASTDAAQIIPQAPAASVTAPSTPTPPAVEAPVRETPPKPTPAKNGQEKPKQAISKTPSKPAPPKSTTASKPKASPSTKAAQGTKSQAATPTKPLRKAPAPQAAPESGYTLQLFGVSERTAASGFISRHGISGSARIIDTKRNGKPWYVVVYGRYTARTAAQNAASRLPPAIAREVQPWVRDVRSVNALQH